MKLSYSDLPSWAQWLVVLAIIIAAIVAIFGVAHSVWPVIVRMVRNLDTLEKLPDFMDRTTATLAAQDKQIDAVHHEVNFNDGSSAKDAIIRLEADVARIIAHLNIPAERRRPKTQLLKKETP